WDAPHQGAGLASLLLGRWTLNAAGQLRSGLAVTGVRMRLIDVYPGGGFGQRYVMDSTRNTVRLPPYARVDLGLRRTWGEKREWTFAFQLQNVFFRWNASGYDWPEYFDARRRGRAGAADEAFERISLPIIPSLGLEVRW
ncbi:MAG TPA: hypothetical protein VFT96_05610, partial [Gemmatimonadaceae bacterium]|nr:hypothetical protein [Gemmatimonadaceae bacterium]